MNSYDREVDVCIAGAGPAGMILLDKSKMSVDTPNKEEGYKKEERSLNSTSDSKWFHSIWFILVMLFLVLGPLGVPLLWKSPRFPRWAKVMLTVAVLLYTVWILRLSGAIVQKSLDQLQPVIR